MIDMPWDPCNSFMDDARAIVRTLERTSGSKPSARAHIYALEWPVRKKSSLSRKLLSNFVQLTSLNPTCLISIEARIKAYIWPYSLNSRVPLSHPKTYRSIERLFSSPKLQVAALKFMSLEVFSATFLK